jgi:hypothetical protein
MPTYEISAPDGNKYQIEGPEGATQDQVIREVLRQNPFAGKTTEELKNAPSAPFSVADIARSGGTGVVGGLGSLAAVGGASSTPAKYLDEKTQGIQSGLSPARLEEMQRREEIMKRAEESGSTWEKIKAGVGAVTEAPLQSLAQGLGSAVSPVAAAAAAVALAPEALAAGIGIAAAAVVGGLMGAGESKKEINDRVKREFEKAGDAPDVAARKADEAQAWTGQNLDQIMINAGAGALEGATGVGRYAAGAARSARGLKPIPTKPLTAPTKLGTVAGAAAEEAAPEFIQSLAGTAAGNVAASRAGFQADTFEGATSAATRDALIGALTGAAVSPVQYKGLQNDFLRQQQDEANKKQEEFQKQREEFVQKYQQQQEETKKNLGLNMLALPAPATTVEDKYRNPAATITRQELGETEENGKKIKSEALQYLDDYRKANNLPALKAYSIEDIQDAMPGLNPEGEKGIIDSILAGKYGYKPVDDKTGNEIKYTPDDVISLAEEEKNIATGTQGFKDFLTSVTGTDNVNEMSQPQLHAAYSALHRFQRSEETKILPEGTAATRFSQKQYDNALKVINVEFASVDNKPLDPSVIIKEIKESTGLENDRDALAILDSAIKNGDLALSTKPVYRVVDPATGKFVHTSTTRAKAEAYAKGKDLNIYGDSQSYISPTENEIPSERTVLPAGYQIKQERVVEGEEDLLDVMREGKGEPLETIAADKAQERIDALTGSSKVLADRRLKRIERDSATAQRIQQDLDQRIAKGDGNTRDFQIRKTRAEKTISDLRLRIEEDLKYINELSAPIKTRKSETKKQLIKRKLTVTKDGKDIGTFSHAEIGKANAQAQDAILTQMTDEEIQSAIDDKKLGLFREKAKVEQDRRRGPTGFRIAKAKTPETLSPEFVDQAEEIKKKLVPMLQRFGLGKVGLNIVNAIKNNAEGSYLNSLIQLAVDATSPIQTMRHEALHALRDLGFFTDSQWQALTNKAKTEWINKYLKGQNVEVDGKVMSRYDGYVYINQTAPAAWNKANPDKPAREVMSDAALNELLIEEAIADAFGDFDANGSPAGMVAAILKRLNQLFEALRNAITGAGFQTAEDIFGKVERGELKGTKEATAEEKAALRNTTKGLLNPNIQPKYEKIINDVIEEMGLTPEEFASTSLIHQTGKAGTEQFESDLIGGLPEVVQFLQDERRKSGLPLLSIDKPEDRKMIAKLMATEAMAAIRSGGANLEWYDSIINKTLAMAGLKYPELNTDINARMAFRIATAITSQGLNVEDNLAFAMKVYDQFRQMGKFPEIGQGADQSAMTSNFKLANYLLDDMGPDLMRQFLETEFTVDEMRSAGFNVTGELGDEKVLGSSVFGPKIGFGFYSNLNGNFDPVTMDMWFMRTIGRLTGKLKSFKQELYDAQLEKFRNELDNSGGNGVFANQFDQNEIDLAKVDDKAAEKLARKVKSAHEKDYKVNRAGYDDGTRAKSKLVAASETMIKSLDSPKDAPANGTERRNLRDIVRQMVDIIEDKYGKRVPPASLQAVIWYPEQELYKAMGVKLRVTSQNYAGAIEKILLGEGYAEGNLSAAAKLGSRTAQQLAKTAVSKGAKATGAKPVRLGSLETEEKEALLERGRKRVVLEEEKETPKRKRVIFEVAPDPNNKALTAKWNGLPNEVRIEISDRIGNKIIKDALNKFGIKGYVDSQVGSYLDDTNPSFALYLESGDSVAMAKFLGYALSQDSMMVVSPKEVKGLDKTGAVRVNIGNASAKKVDEIYQQLREIEVDGEKPIGGQSFMNGHMVVLNYSNVPTNELAALINDKLEQKYEVITEDVYTSFPEKKDYDYANPSSDPRGNAGVLRQASRDLRSEATRLLQKELRGYKPEAAPAEGKLSLRKAPDTPEFKRWLGNSQVVNEDGEAKPLYHSTYSDFEKPKVNYGNDEYRQWGFHVGSIEAAEARLPMKAEEDKANRVRAGAPNIMPFWVRAENPLRLDEDRSGRWGVDDIMNAVMAKAEKQGIEGITDEDIDSFFDDKFDMDEWLNETGEPTNKERFWQDHNEWASGERSNDLKYFLQRLGYDSIVYKNDFEGGGDSYIVFEPKQVKSAIGNQGTYTESPDTRYSLRSTRQPPESKEFKQWFGESYFVDDEGNPVILYHGTARDITIFKGKQAKAIFVTTKPDVAEDYANMGVDYMRAEAYKALTRDEKVELITVVAEQGERDGTITKAELKEIQSNLKKRVPTINEKTKSIVGLPYQIETEIIASLNNLLPTKGNIMPVYVNARKIFNYANKDHVNQVIEWMTNNTRSLGRKENPEQWLASIKGLISNGNWVRIESEEVQEAIRALDFDGFSVLEAGSKNYAVYNPTNIKSVTGNIGTFGLGEVTSEQAKQFGMTAEQAKQAQEEGDIRFSLRKAPDTPAFKRWFGKSKVVDDDGNPLVVYHTGAFDANEIISAAEQYRRTYGKSSGYMQGGNEGIYFSADPLYSSLYGKREGKTMYPVYLSIQNPFVVENKEQMSRLVKLKNFILGKREVFRNSIISDTTDPSTDSMYITPEYKAELIKRGYDGIVNKEHNEIVAFESTQIKSAIGNQGTYDFTNPDIRYSLKSQVAPNIVSSIEKTTTVREEKGFVERMMDAISPKGFSSWRAEAINRYNALSIADKIKIQKRGGVALYADQSAEAMALLSDDAAGVAASAMGVHDRHGGVPVFRNGITTIDDSVEGILPIFAPLAKYKDPFVYQMYQFYSGAKRARRYLDKGIERNYDANDIAYAEQLGKQYPEFEEIFKKWDKYNKGLVKYQVDTGVLSPAEGAEYIKYSDYVPFYRQLEGENTFGPNVFQSISGVKKGKKYKGGEAPIADFMETIVRNTQSAIQAGMKNTAAKMAVDTFVEIDQAELAPDGSTGEEYVHVLEGGVKKSYLVYDKALVQSVMSLNLPDLPFIGFFAGPANLLRNLVTKDPGFMLSNMVRDSMSAWVTSGVKMTPVASAIKNFTGAMAGTSPEYKALLNAGILGGYEYSQGVEVSAANMKKALGRYEPSTGLNKLKNVPTSLWETLEKGTMASDAATRIEVYKNVLAETGNEAEALYRAQEVMNFQRKGRSAVVRILTAAIPFLNARIQGLDVLYRAMSGQMGTTDAKKIQKAFFVRGASIMAMSMVYWALTHDDDEYKKQEQETRDNYWLIPSMGIKIPIPFEVGVIFKVIPERIAEYFFGNDTGKDFADSMKRNFQSTFMFNLIPQTVLPFYEAKTNYSFFTGRNIIGAGLEGVAPEYQVGPNTSQLAAWFGKQTGYSPMLIDHVIGGYTGTFGSYAVDVIDSIAFANSDVQRPSKRFEQLPVFKRFLLDPQAKGNVTAYYDLKNSVDEAVRTSNFLEKTSNFEEMGKYNEETLKVLASKEFISDMERDMKELREMSVFVRSSTLSPDDKRDMLMSITDAENAMTANVKYLRKLMD